MTQTELARKLGISGGYLWKLYHGYALPSKRMSNKIKKHTKMEYESWGETKLSNIQKMFNRMMED